MIWVVVILVVFDVKISFFWDIDVKTDFFYWVLHTNRRKTLNCFQISFSQNIMFTLTLTRSKRFKTAERNRKKDIKLLSWCWLPSELLFICEQIHLVCFRWERCLMRRNTECVMRTLVRTKRETWSRIWRTTAVSWWTDWESWRSGDKLNTHTFIILIQLLLFELETWNTGSNISRFLHRQKTLLWCWQTRVREKLMRDVWMRWVCAAEEEEKSINQSIEINMLNI